MNGRNKVFIVALFAGLALAVYYPVLLTGRVMLPTDILNTYYPWRHYSEGAVKNPALMDSIAAAYPAQKYFHDSLAEGRVPLWNPYQTAGQPFAANIQNGVFYPVQALLTLAMPTERMFGWSAFLHTFLAGLAMFMLLRVFRCSGAAAVMGGVAYMLGGWMLVWATWPSFIGTAAWVPMIILFYELAIQRRSCRFAALSGVSIGVAILAGCPQVVAYALLTAGALAVGDVVAKRREGAVLRRLIKNSLMALVAVASGAVLSAVQLMQMMELMSHTSRAGFGKAAGGSGMYVFRLLMVAAPDIFGNVSRGAHLFNHTSEFVENMAYFGAPALFLALMALAIRRDRLTVAWFALAVFGICGAVELKAMSPLFSLPGFSMMRANRMIYFVALSGPVLAALAWDAVLAKRRCVVALGAAVCFAGSCVVALLLWRAVLRQNFPMEQLVLFLKCGVIRLAIGLIAVGIAIAVAVARARPVVASGLVVLAIAADLLWWGHGFNPASRAETVYPKTASIEYLREKNGLSRIHGYFYTLFLPNAGSVYGLYDVRGYEPIALKRYGELVRRLNSRVLKRELGYTAFVFPSVYAGPFVNLMGVRRLVSYKPMDVKGLAPEYMSDIIVYKNKDALSRAVFYGDWTVERDAGKVADAVISDSFRPDRELYLEEEPGIEKRSGHGVAGSAEIVKYEPEEIRIRVNARRAGMVFVSDPWDSGWTAEVDGRASKLLIADYAFRAAAVAKAGRHDVVMRYRPLSARAGAIVTLVSSFAFVVFFAGMMFEKKSLTD